MKLQKQATGFDVHASEWRVAPDEGSVSQIHVLKPIDRRVFFDWLKRPQVRKGKVRGSEVTYQALSAQELKADYDFRRKLWDDHILRIEEIGHSPFQPSDEEKRQMWEFPDMANTNLKVIDRVLNPQIDTDEIESLALSDDDKALSIAERLSVAASREPLYRVNVDWLGERIVFTFKFTEADRRSWHAQMASALRTKQASMTEIYVYPAVWAYNFAADRVRAVEGVLAGGEQVNEMTDALRHSLPPHLLTSAMNALVLWLNQSAQD